MIWHFSMNAEMNGATPLFIGYPNSTQISEFLKYPVCAFFQDLFRIDLADPGHTDQLLKICFRNIHRTASQVVFRPDQFGITLGP